MFISLRLVKPYTFSVIQKIIFVACAHSNYNCVYSGGEIILYVTPYKMLMMSPKFRLGGIIYST